MQDARFKEFAKNAEGNQLLNFLKNGMSVEELEKVYLRNANTKSYVEDWYKLVQLANEYITKVEPWKKYKEEATKQEAIEDLEFLLWVIKQLGLLAAPLLINGFAKLQKILGNVEILKIASGENNLKSDFCDVFDLKEFEVNLEPMIMYEKKEV